jgi:amino acid adenylation domain-containing protein
MERTEEAPALRQESDAPGNGAQAPSPESQPSVIDEIYDLMSQTPHAMAVTDGDLEWTYEDLRRRTDIVARSLADGGIARGSVVGMHLPRCADAIAVMLGIMVSGCVYLPLDPSYPAARLRSMLDRAGAAAVISPGDDPELYGPDRSWLPAPSQLVTGPEAAASETAAGPAERELARPDESAYIIFTSGSTGEPKGVLVTHGNITLLSEWSAKVLGLTPFDASATSSSLSFDPSFLEVLLPLSVGGTVHVIPHALALGQLTRPVSFVASTPSVMNELLLNGQLPSLKALIVGGESLAPDVAAAFLTSGRVERLLNCYGPTECTVGVTVAEVTVPVPDVIPIGRPVPGTDILFLDEEGQQVPDGEAGEVCIFGGQVAAGYVNNPAETAARFATGPGATGEPQRYYRTGDLGYRGDDGVIFFAGRADRQVKINGVRIELGEIDAALRSHPQVSEATTVVQDDARAIAYVVPAEAGADVDIADLRKHLSGSLPRFMRPAGIIVLAELPKTLTGKLDTAALPEWSPSRAEGEPVAVDQVDKVTARVIEIVADVTGFAGQIRPADDFINDLGGTSLGILRVLVELERDSGRRLRINDALADTTVAGLAGLLRADTVSSPADFAFNTDGDAPPIFFIHSYLGSMLAFRRMAELLPPSQPAYGLHVYGSTEHSGTEITVSSLAEDALARVREVQPAGPIVLLGHSAGGLLVFEAARKMVEAGQPEPRVLLMDTPQIDSAFGYYWSNALLSWRDIIRSPVRALRGPAERLAQKVRPAKTPRVVPPPSDDLMTVNEKNGESIDVAIRTYRAPVYGGSITVMRTRQGRVLALGRRALGWASVTTGRVEIIDAPGDHLTMLEAPFLPAVTEKLVDWLSSSE